MILGDVVFNEPYDGNASTMTPVDVITIVLIAVVVIAAITIVVTLLRKKKLKKDELN